MKVIHSILCLVLLCGFSSCGDDDDPISDSDRDAIAGTWHFESIDDPQVENTLSTLVVEREGSSNVYKFNWNFSEPLFLGVYNSSVPELPAISIKPGNAKSLYMRCTLDPSGDGGGYASNWFFDTEQMIRFVPVDNEGSDISMRFAAAYDLTSTVDGYKANPQKGSFDVEVMKDKIIIYIDGKSICLKR